MLLFKSNRSLRFWLLLLLGWTTLVAVSVKAQDLDELLSLDLTELLQVKVTTATLYEQSRADSPSRIVVITKRQIRERGYNNLFDALVDLSAVDTQAASHETSYNNITIRGISGSKFLVLRNGTSISSPARDPIAYADNMPLFDVERIEIVLSPGSSIYGADAYSGTINLITKRSYSKPRNLGVGYAAGSYDYRYGYAYLDQAVGDQFRFSVDGHRHASDNENLLSEYPQSFPITDLTSFSGELVLPAERRTGFYGRTESSSLSVGLDYSDMLSIGYHATSFSSPTATGLLPFSVDYGLPAFWKSELKTAFVKFRRPLRENLNLSIDLDSTEYEVNPKSRFNNIFSNFKDGFKYAKTDRTMLTATLEWQASDEDVWMLGVQQGRFQTIPKSADLSHPYQTSQSTAEQALYYDGTDDTLAIALYDIRYNNRAAFVHYQAKVSDKILLSAGVRVDDSSRYGKSTNPRLGLVYNASEKWNFKLIYAQAYLSPAPELTYEHFGSFTGEKNDSGEYISNFMFVPNPDLQPEKIKTLEFNASYNPHQNILAELTLYRSEATDHILNTAMRDPVTDFVPGGYIYNTSHNDNIGDMDITGLTLDVSYQTRMATTQFETWGNYSYTEGEYCNTLTGQRTEVPFVATHKLKMGVTARRERGYLTLSLRNIGTTNADVAALIGDEVEQTEARNYWVVGAVAGINDVLPNLDVSVNIHNLLNKHYYNTGTNAAITFVETPQNLREIRLLLDYRL